MACNGRISCRMESSPGYPSPPWRLQPFGNRHQQRHEQGKMRNQRTMANRSEQVVDNLSPENSPHGCSIPV